ncbi:nuclear transport factor 2 family protein [Sphingomonas profundi]|uniref:nuclear transport factor 2 family protein n=1 Tax=Alterirhizorhabdus profundi TaxID=2681549 RepID=UPI0012E87754|nr:nuclear transport factor 2 family protein [Sphingomonas profundi]
MKPFDLEAEVRDLCARRDIQAAHFRYMRGQDRLLPDLQRSAFHADAWDDCGIMAGPYTEFVDFAQGLLAGFTSSQHLTGQMDITVEGDVAHGEIYFIAQHRIVEDGEDKDLFVAGRYIDRYECRDGDWRIARRKELIDWARTDKASDSFLASAAVPADAMGARGEADFSTHRRWPA